MVYCLQVLAGVVCADLKSMKIRSSCLLHLTTVVTRACPPTLLLQPNIKAAVCLQLQSAYMRLITELAAVRQFCNCDAAKNIVLSAADTDAVYQSRVRLEIVMCGLYIVVTCQLSLCYIYVKFMMS